MILLPILLTSSLKYTYVTSLDKKSRKETGLWYGETFLRNLVFLQEYKKELFLPFEHGNHWS
jgi:predicted transposase YdaD